VAASHSNGVRNKEAGKVGAALLLMRVGGFAVAGVPLREKKLEPLRVSITN
jgi:hypothetical protein